MVSALGLTWTLAINEVEATCDVSIAMDASSDHGISKDEADGIIQEVKGAVSSWRRPLNEGL
jgi:serine/threonine-protein kinase HipA